MLDLHGRLAVVVGAGKVGLRKAAGLRRAGAAVRVVADRAAAEAVPDGVEVVVAPYRPELLDGAFLVFACTDDRAANSAVRRDARQRGALVNVVDCPEECDFYAPAVLADGEVVLAVGTGGAAPALAAWLKRRLAEAVPRDVGAFAAALEDARQRLRQAVADAPRRMEIMRALVCGETYEAFLLGGPPAVRRRLDRLISRSGDAGGGD